jgi:AAA+ ATPase superfamily predicted ATPase
MKTFIGRKNELKKLQELQQSFRQKGLASLVVIKGRRRIGKSRLAEEYAKGQRFLMFSGIPPTDNVTPQSQRDTFARQFSQNFCLPPLQFADWSDALYHLSHHVTDDPTVILFDEISWMGSKDPTFIPKLKAWWDMEIQNRSNLMIIFCGSVSTWIEENILNSTAFFGRISLTIDLSPLSLPECAEFLRVIGFKGSPYDTYKLLAVTGGVPWYLEQVFASEMADANITRLCFSKDGVLATEFDRIFHDLFQDRGALYKSVISLLSGGMKTLTHLRKEAGYASSGTFSGIMQDLITAGFVTRHYQWSLKSGRPSKYSLYRLSDPYTRFYMKYIEPNRLKLDQNSFQNVIVNQLPGWDAIMGFQVESLLLQNRHLLLKALGIHVADIIADNPYFQNPTTRQKGCQIDYLVQTHSKNLFFCEFKFKRRELTPDIIEATKETIRRFSVPRGFGVAPVLFHLGGVSDAVYDPPYFYRIIDIADFLEASAF